MAICGCAVRWYVPSLAWKFYDYTVIQLAAMLLATMVNCATLLVDQMRMKVEWRFAMKISGEQFVTMDGVHRMLKWCADSLAFKRLVNIY